MGTKLVEKIQYDNDLNAMTILTEVQGDHVVKCADEKIQNELQSDTNPNVKCSEQVDELTMCEKEKLESYPLQTLQEVMDVGQGAGFLQGDHLTKDHGLFINFD